MWLSNPNMISHTEGYIVAIQEQEIYTRALKAKREHADDHSYNKMCRFCNEKIEDIFHLLCSCNFLSASMYLPLRHDEVAREAYNAIIKHHFPDLRYTLPQSVWKYGHLEIWWDTHISTTPRVKHNKPDMVIWNHRNMTCSVVDICVPLDRRRRGTHTGPSSLDCYVTTPNSSSMSYLWSLEQQDLLPTP